MKVLLCVFLVKYSVATQCQRPWSMKTADKCAVVDSEEYFFFNNRSACITAPGRDVYCNPPNDMKFCAEQDKGNFTGMWQVECG